MSADASNEKRPPRNHELQIARVPDTRSPEEREAAAVARAAARSRLIEIILRQVMQESARLDAQGKGGAA